MLFNSFEYLFLFLPLTLAGFMAISYWRDEWGMGLLVCASLFFYGWWDYRYLGLLCLSMLVNYGIGVRLSKGHARGRPSPILLAFGVTLNLSALAYFKYASFLLENLSPLFHTEVAIPKIILPLAISFFTFQQIAFLVDAYRGETSEYKFVHYALFVTFFAQLIAGPIVHHREMLPQFERGARVNAGDAAKGLTFLIIGLVKKVVIADSIAPYANAVFQAASHGPVSIWDAWGGALAYTHQLYFDFSGYADMAIGAGLLFGVMLPFNFDSPYKADTVIEFWRRWHITLSRFLRDYLYIPLGGNRKGQVRRYANLLITMVLGGLWHGAGWGFVIWGTLHGVYLLINHAFRWIRQVLGVGPLSYPLARVLTFVSVVCAWVFFRAESVHSAMVMLATMAGRSASVSTGPGLVDAVGWTGLVAATLAVWILPNSQAWVLGDSSQLRVVRGWCPSVAYAVCMALAAGLAVLSMSQVSEFLYFQF